MVQLYISIVLVPFRYLDSCNDNTVIMKNVSPRGRSPRLYYQLPLVEIIQTGQAVYHPFFRIFEV